MLPTALLRCNISSKGAVFPAGAMTRRLSPQTRYTFRRYTASIMKDLIYFISSEHRLPECFLKQFDCNSNSAAKPKQPFTIKNDVIFNCNWNHVISKSDALQSPIQNISYVNVQVLNALQLEICKLKILHFMLCRITNRYCHDHANCVDLKTNKFTA